MIKYFRWNTSYRIGMHREPLVGEKRRYYLWGTIHAHAELIKDSHAEI